MAEGTIHSSSKPVKFFTTAAWIGYCGGGTALFFGTDPPRHVSCVDNASVSTGMTKTTIILEEGVNCSEEFCNKKASLRVIGSLRVLRVLTSGVSGN